MDIHTNIITYAHANIFSAHTRIQSEQSSLARDVALSALVGENIYNFGELIQHPIIKILSDGAGTELYVVIRYWCKWVVYFRVYLSSIDFFRSK